MTIGYHSENPEDYIAYLPDGRPYNANNFARLFPNRLKFLEEQLGFKHKEN